MSDPESSSRTLLESSVAHLDARVRSRLTQARHAALDELDRCSQRTAWPRLLAPVVALGSAAAVALVLWSQRPEGAAPRMAAATIQDTLPEEAAPAPTMLASVSSDEVDFLLGQDPLAAVLEFEEPAG